MQAYPLIEILFFIANFLAPAQVNLISIDGPDVSAIYSRTSSGWEYQKATWKSQDSNVLVSEGSNQASTNVKRFVEPLLNKTWDGASPLKLEGMTQIEKTKECYLFKINVGDPAEKQYRITFGIKKS